MRPLYHFDNLDNQIGTIYCPLSVVRNFEINGDHMLDLTSLTPMDKEDRIVYQDALGTWREFTVVDTEDDDSDGRVVYTAHLADSIEELAGEYIVEKEPTGGATHCLEVALQGSRWEIGIVDVPGTNRMSWYHTSALAAIYDIVDTFGAELSTTIIVEGSKVVRRLVNLRARLGTDKGKRFTYRRGLKSVRRIREVGKVYTRLYGYGSGVALTDEYGNETGGFSRKITFGEINNGLDYVETDDVEMMKRWGRPDSNGGYAHTTGKVEFEDCEDPEELLELTEKYFIDQLEPKASYEADVIDFLAAGFDAVGVDEGDTVYITDELFNPPLHLTARVMAAQIDELAPENSSITLSNVQESFTDRVIKDEQKSRSLYDHAASWDAAAKLPESYLQSVVNRLNDQFRSGGSYKFESFEQGTIYSNVPLDENGKPTRTPASAFQLTGAGFRIASNVNTSGEFEWRTFGTGDGFTADVINAGSIRGGSSYWNLETGELVFREGFIGDVDGLTYWDITNKAFVLTEANGKGIVYRDGKLTIDAESVYIGASTVQKHMESYTDSAIKVVNDSITSTVKQIEKDVDGQLTALESRIEQTIDGISLSVTNGKLGQSASITLTVDGDKQTQNIDLKSGMRQAFADDKTAVTISGGKITFNSGTIVINSTNFTVDANGKITAKSGTIGKFNITDKALYSGSKSTFNSSTSGVHLSDEGISLGSTFKVTNAGELTASKGKIANFTLESTKLYTGSKSSLSANATGVYIGSDGIALGGKSGSDNLFSVTSAGVLTAMSGKIAGFDIKNDMLQGRAVRLGISTIDMYSDMAGFHIGSFCGCYYTSSATMRYVGMQSGSSAKGLVFSINAPASASGSVSRNTATVRAMYSTQAFGTNFIAGWNFWGPVNFHGGTLSDCTIASTASLSIAGTVKDQMNFIAVTKINDDGTIAEYVDGCSLEFENGLLVDMVKPEEE